MSSAGSGAEMSGDSLAAGPYDQDSLEEEELMDGERVEEDEEEEGELADTLLQVPVSAAGKVLTGGCG